jgi:hypothetical protein
MTYDYCPCCQVDTLPHADDCTFASDCPVECEQFNAVAELRGEVARLNAVIESLRREVRTQRLEIAGLREERRALLEADRPPGWQTDPT